MSLYYEAAAILTNAENTGGSLKSRIYNNKKLKSPPAQLFALVSETSKWSAVLKDVLERSGVLKEERKLTPILALLLTHDLLLAKGGVAAPANHVLRLAITRHKARLQAEFTKSRIRHGFSTLDAFRAHINAGAEGGDNGDTAPAPSHPRWIRINTLVTTLSHQLTTTFADYDSSASLSAVCAARGSAKLLHVDSHIPNLIALPPKADFSRHPAYARGELIFQDKASCFPAYLLDPSPESGPTIDACAAPGNKTTHLAAILSEKAKSAADGSKPQVLAFERDKRRAGILSKMTKLAGAGDIVQVRGPCDFLTSDPLSPSMRTTSMLLLDPSCSGSGIVGRDDTLRILLPSVEASTLAKQAASKHGNGKKRKRNGIAGEESRSVPAEITLSAADAMVEETAEEAESKDALMARLRSLSAFQLKIILHAMKFPHAVRITYSTCSTHFIENEKVVFLALASEVARERGWRILKRKDQVDGMKRWAVRGEMSEEEEQELPETGWDGGVEEKNAVLDACIRCAKGTQEGTMGFFVAGFVRDDVGPEGDEDMGQEDDASESAGRNPMADAMAASNSEEKGVHEHAGAGSPEPTEDEEWNGFSDDDVAGEDRTSTSRSNVSAKHSFARSSIVRDGSSRKKKTKKRK